MKDLERMIFGVRRRFEQRTISRKKLETLYAAYNTSVEDVAAFVQKAEELFPRLNCGLASVYLKDVLGYGEIIQGLYKDHSHTFLKLFPDDTIVDITADQYGGPAIYIGRLKNPWRIKEGPSGAF